MLRHADPSGPSTNGIPRLKLSDFVSLKYLGIWRLQWISRVQREPAPDRPLVAYIQLALLYNTSARGRRDENV